MGVASGHGALAASSPELPPGSKRRRLNSNGRAAAGRSPATAIDLTSDCEDNSPASSYRPRKQPRNKREDEAEKRARRFRHGPPRGFQERLSRAQSQRMFVIDRQRQNIADAPKEIFQLAGSTGNIYTVTIDKMPSCTCPDNIKGNQCKHIIYVVCNVLKATGKLRYQLAYLSSELKEIFDSAPFSNLGSGQKHSSKQKPVEGDCPICFTEFEPGQEEILFCQRGCGNNVHKECFHQWVKSRPRQEPRCVFCRAMWQADDDCLAVIREALAKQRPVGVSSEGYANVADELGISRVRDHSSYHQPWVMSRGRSVSYGNLL